MNNRKRLMEAALLILVVAGMICYGTKGSEEWEDNYTGIPDAVSSMSSDNWQYLKVVANSDRIEDKEAFACEVVRMCRENSFHTIRFSTDINGYPRGLTITVYLNRRGVERNEPVCEIDFRTEEYREDWDIKNNVEHFQLYLDGKEIDFYE